MHSWEEDDGTINIPWIREHEQSPDYVRDQKRNYLWGKLQCWRCWNDRLQDYMTNDDFRKFVREMRAASFMLQHYNGRFFYQGPAAVVTAVQDGLRVASMPLQWDSYGLNYLVYPKVPGQQSTVP